MVKLSLINVLFKTHVNMGLLLLAYLLQETSNLL